MSEINTVFDVKSTKQLLSLAKSLKNNNALQNNMLKHLLMEKPEAETVAKETINRKFTNHPSLLSSETDVSIPAIPLTNGYLKEALYHHSIKNCDSSESLRSKDSDVNCNHIQHSNLHFSPNHSRLQKSRSNFNSQAEDEFVEQDERGCSHPFNLNTHEQEYVQNLIYNKILQQKSNYFSKREYDSKDSLICKKMPPSKIRLESHEIDSEDNLFSNKMRPQTSNCIKPRINDSKDNLGRNKLPLQNQSEDNLFLNKMLPQAKAHENDCEDNLVKKIYSEGYINSKPHKHDTEANLVSHKKPAKGTLKRPSTTSMNSYASVDQKLRYVLPRILGYLEDIRILMDEDYPLPDGEEDWLRRRNCDSEFCTRFSRNYLYELGRQTNELQKLMNNPGKASFPVSGNIHSCLSRSHQTVLQALEFYLHHMPGALPNAVIDKLKILLEHVSGLCDLHTKCMNLDQTGTSRRENLIEMVRKKTEELLVKVQGTIDRFMMPTPKCSMNNMDVVKKRKTRRSALEARFSMYSISQVARTSAYWKKAVNAATRDRYSYVHSRYKTAVLKHRQPQPAEKSTTKLKPFPKHSSVVVINKTPIRTIRDEDDNIQTIVGMARGRETDDLSYGGNILPPSETIQQPENKAEQRTNKITDYNIDLRAQFLIQQLYLLIHPEDVSQKGLANFTKHLTGMDPDGKINTSNEETGSKENGYINEDIQIAHGILHDLNHRSREMPVPKAIEYHEQNEVAVNHHKVVSEDHSVKTESKDKLTKKQRKNGEAKAIVTKKSDVNTQLTRHTKSLDVFDIFQNYKKKCDERASLDALGDIEIRQTSSSTSKRHHTVVSVVGEKNAQLICIRDDDRLLEAQDDDEITTDHRCEDCYNKGILCENQINIIHKQSGQEVVFRPGRPNYDLKMGRLPKKTIHPVSLKLPDQHVANVMKYRSNFCKYLKSDYLYQKEAKTKPWILVDRLAEFMLDDVVIAIVDEIKVNLMVDDIIHSEFL